LRKAVYTVITNWYDKLREPFERESGWDYFCFSDTYQKSRVWKVLRVSGPDKRRLSRLPKIKWFDYLDYDITIYVDANWKIIKSLDEIIETHHKYGHHSAFRHWDRDCVYEEAKLVAKMKKSETLHCNRYAKMLKRTGFPKHAGLMANGFMIRGKELPKEPYQRWWHDVQHYSYRDQLSFMPNAQDLQLNFIPQRFRFDYLRAFNHGLQ